MTCTRIVSRLRSNNTRPGPVIDLRTVGCKVSSTALNTNEVRYKHITMGQPGIFVTYNKGNVSNIMH